MAATFHTTGNGAQTSGAASFTFTTAIVSSIGDGMVVFGSWDAASTTTPTVVTTGGTGSESFTLIYGPLTSGIFKYGAWLLATVVGAGRSGVTVSWASSNPSFADAGCTSFSGLTTPTLDGQGFATGSSATINSTDTATLQSADEFAVGYAASTNAITAASAPWTDDGTIGATASWIEHRILAATTAIHTNFTEASGTWITFALTFMAAPTFIAKNVAINQAITRASYW